MNWTGKRGSVPDPVITPLARQDLKGIGRHTQERWGVAQRDTYLQDLATLFGRLGDGTVLGRRRDEIREGLLAQPCGRHVVFFRRDVDGNVEVLRVLHERMDFRRHL